MDSTDVVPQYETVDGEKEDQDQGNDEDEEEDIAQTDHGATSWLKDLGLNAAKFRSLDPNKVKLYPLKYVHYFFEDVLCERCENCIRHT